MHSSKSPYVAVSSRGSETLDDEGRTPAIVTACYRPDEIHTDSRYSGVVVTQPRAAYAVVNEERAPPSYLWLSICTLCFCCPLAICAIIKSRESARHAGSGDYAKALAAGKCARNLAIWAIMVGLILTVIVYQKQLKQWMSSCYPDC